ncbi:maltose O-acetyltransferase [gut metagenome]|uniref:Maltose O-acetyltransferase n=1 Tax=gut metagenome TaxID=749906 RepID=J9GV42_9ZZZZ
MKTELEKMRSEELYSFADPEVYASYMQADRACQRLNATCLSDVDYRPALEALLPGIPTSAMVVPPFFCDHAHGITLGEHVFINRQVTMLNSGRITIGAHTLIGPNCSFYTPEHPFDYLERRQPVETGYPITIGEDCWLGGNVIVVGGVTIGPRSVIGAGSVVVKDIPADTLAVGNPCRPIRKLR